MRGYNDGEDRRLDGIQPINEMDDGPGFGFNESPERMGEDGSGFGHPDFNQQQHQRLLGDESHSRFGIVSQNPSRTAGQITLKELQAEDISRDPYLSRDAAVLVEAELR